MTESTNLYLVRHGRVRDGEEIVYGFLPGYPLSDLGQRQAEAVGRRLANAGISDVYAGPLERSQETADIITRHCANAKVTTLLELNEGAWLSYLQGCRWSDVRWRRPRWWFQRLYPGLLPPAETVKTMAARVRKALDIHLAAKPGVAAAFVSHGDPIEAFLITAESRPAKDLNRRLTCQPGGVVELTFEGRTLSGHRYVPPSEDLGHAKSTSTGTVPAGEGSSL